MSSIVNSAFQTISKACFLFGLITPKDEKTKRYVAYVNSKRRLANLRRTTLLAALLIVMIFIMLVIPHIIPNLDYKLALLLVGTVFLLMLYLALSRKIFLELSNSPESKKWITFYTVIIIIFWSMYYFMLIVVAKTFDRVEESIIIWMALMAVGLSAHAFSPIEAAVIFPVSFVNIGVYVISRNLEVSAMVTCMPIVAFFFCVVQSNHFERLENYYEEARVAEESSVNKRRLGNIFTKVFDIAVEINYTSGECEVLKPNDFYSIDLNKPNMIITEFFERTIAAAHPDDRYLFTKNLNVDYINNEFMTGRNQIYFEGRLMTEQDEYGWVSMLFIKESIQDDDHFLLFLVQNIDERKHQEVKLKLEAEKDPLTQLYNKTTTRSLIEECLEKNPSSQHALIIIDIDNFKTINDTRGHVVGDQILLAFTAELNKNFRETDILGRVGGDEFVVLIKNVQSIAMVCDKLQTLTSSFKKYGIDHGFPGRLSCSIGVAVFNKDGKTYEELFKKADAALYEAKRNGKDQYKFSITRSLQ